VAFFCSILKSCLDFYAPLQLSSKRKSKHPTPWMTPSILLAIKNKKLAKRKAEASHDPNNAAVYKKIKNQLKILVKASLFTNLINNTRKDPSSSACLWAGINNVIGRDNSNNHTTIDSKKLSLDDINEFFRNIAITTSHQPASSFTPNTNASSNKFCFENIEPFVVMSLLKRLDVRKAVGPDGFSASFLKKIAPEIVFPLTLLYNKSLSSGTIPLEWKKCNVTPIHKSGSFEDPGNFRPISVVPIIAKLLEKIVAFQLNSYFEKNHLLFDYQGAYRRGRSTEQLPLTLLYMQLTIRLLLVGF